MTSYDYSKQTATRRRRACWWSATRCSTATGTARSSASRPKRRCRWSRSRARKSASAPPPTSPTTSVTLGAQASFLGVVGDDEPGHRLEALLRETGIATHLKRDPGLKTTVKLRVIGRQQQLLRMDFENEPDHEVLALQNETFAQLAPQHDAVLFSDYGKGGLAHIGTMIAARPRRPARRCWSTPRARTTRATAAPPSSRPTGPSCSRWWAAGTTTDELRAKAQNLREALRLDALLVTLRRGRHDAVRRAGRTRTWKPRRARCSTSPAPGDTVIATLAAMVGAGMRLRDAMPIANKAGGIVVGKFGTATVSYEELFA